MCYVARFYRKIAVMKYLLLVTIFFRCSPSVDYDKYGLEITPTDAISVEALLSQVGQEALTLKVEGVIEEVCQMKGCWMTLKNEAGLAVRVTFKDYGFFVPKDIHGKHVIIEGEALMEIIDEAQARHYAQDGGVEYEESMRNSISFVAHGVLVEKS